MEYIGEKENIDPDEYFSYYISQIYYEILSDPEKKKKNGNIPFLWVDNKLRLEKCKNDRFKGVENEAKALGIEDHYYCPEENFNITLQGSFSG